MKTKKLKKKDKKDIKEIESFMQNSLIVTFHPKALDIIERVAKLGIYGKSCEEVVERLTCETLERFVETEDIKLKL